MKSPIETVIGVELERELRAGVPHFKSGQMGAHRIDQHPDQEFIAALDDAEVGVALTDVFELWRVDQMGRAWLVLFERKADGSWFPLYGFHGGQVTIRLVEDIVVDAIWNGVPAEFVEVLDKAYEGSKG